MTQLLLLLLLICDGRRTPPTTHVDLIEVNHCHDDCKRFRFTQLILWECSPDYRRYHVVVWWIPDKLGDELQGLVAKRSGKTYASAAVRETWTDYDPEVVNRKVFPVEKRRGW